MLLYVVLVLPILLFVPHPPHMQRILQAIGLVLLTIGIGASITTPFSHANALHSLGGFVVYLALVGAALVGDAVPWQTTCSNVLVYVGVPTQLLTGLIAMLALADDSLSGPAGSAAAASASAALVALAAAYVSTSVSSGTSVPELKRAYTVMVLESTGIVLGGLGGILYVVYFERTHPFLVAHVALGAFVFVAGLSSLYIVMRHVTTSRLLPTYIVRGLPAIVLANAVTVVLVVWPRSSNTYVGTANALLAFAVALASVARATRTLHCMAFPLCVAAAITFTSQLGVERMFLHNFTHDTGTTFAWWAGVSTIGFLSGFVVYACCGHRHEQAIAEKRARRRARTPADIDADVDDLVADTQI